VDPVPPTREEAVAVVDDEGAGGLVYLFKFFPNFFFGSDEDEERGCDEFM